MNALKLFLLFLACSVVSSCVYAKTAVPIKGDDVLSVDTKGIDLPFNKSIAIKISNQERNKLIRLRGGILRDGELMYEAASKVFSRVFTNVTDIAINPSCADMVMNISGSAEIETSSGNFVAKNQVDLSTTDNNILWSYSSEGKAQSDFLLDSNALRNAYIISFNKIVEQMLSNNKFMNVVKSQSICQAH